MEFKPTISILDDHKQAAHLCTMFALVAEGKVEGTFDEVTGLTKWTLKEDYQKKLEEEYDMLCEKTAEMMMSLLWFYRPEHTDIGRQPDDCRDEVFASKHRDFTSVACIEDKCFVMTFNEYCR